MSSTFTLIPTPEYLNDLRSALAYVRDNLRSPIAASGLAQGIRAAEELIATFPKSSPLSQKPGLSGRGFREKIAGNYVIVYMIDGEKVYLLKLFHQSQDFERWL